jgi:multidrug efflux pump subunit AcrA (membrane-fusion protein)
LSSNCLRELTHGADPVSRVEPTQSARGLRGEPTGLPGAQVAGDPQDRSKRCAGAGAFGSRWLLQANIAEAKARHDSAAAFLDEGKADLDQCSVRAPAAGTIKVLVTLGQFVSTYAPTTLVHLTPDAK